jgi:hypothetical protein
MSINYFGETFCSLFDLLMAGEGKGEEQKRTYIEIISRAILIADL